MLRYTIPIPLCLLVYKTSIESQVSLGFCQAQTTDGKLNIKPVMPSLNLAINCQIVSVQRNIAVLSLKQITAENQKPGQEKTDREESVFTGNKYKAVSIFSSI